MITLDFSWNICKPIKQFNKTIKNTLTNLISHQTIICVDKNLPWINNKVKSLAREKNKSLMHLTKMISVTSRPVSHRD